MAKLLLGLAVVVVVATVYAVIDCALIASNRVRGLPKVAWLIVILLIPVLGVLLWFTIGRGRVPLAKRPQLAPDDDPAFIGTLGRDREQDERIRKLEEELATLDSDAAEPDTGAGRPGAAPTAPDTTADPDSDEKLGRKPDDSGRTDA